MTSSHSAGTEAVVAFPEQATIEPGADEDYTLAEAGQDTEAFDAEPLQMAEVRSLSVYRAARQHQLGYNATRTELIAQAQQGDEAAMEKLWLDSQELAGTAANSRRHSRLPIEDMVQVALEVVPGTIRRYDSDKGVPFEAFLFRRMLGAIIDAERQLGRADGLTRDDYGKIQAALRSDDPDASLHELTQPQKTADGKSAPGLVTAPQLVANGAVSTSHKSLDAPFRVSGSDGGDELTAGAKIASDHDVHIEAVQSMENDSLRVAIEALPERERLAVTHYHGLAGPNMTLQEIGRQILGGVTESRASQIHSSAIRRLGRILNGQEEARPPEKPASPRVSEELPVIEDDFKDRLPKRQYEAVGLLHLTYGEIAERLDMSEGAVRGLVRRAKVTLGIDNIEDLAVGALRRGVIPADDIPGGKTAGLTSRQNRLVRDCYNMTRGEAAKAQGLSPNTIRFYRHNIYVRTGAKNSVHLALMAFKDRLITPEFQASPA